MSHASVADTCVTTVQTREKRMSHVQSHQK